MAATQEGRLKQGMTGLDVVALGVGAAIGMSIFSVMAPAAQAAGPGLLVSLALAAIPMVVFTVVYAFMGSAVPRSGSSYDWPAQFVHPFVGFIVNWLRILGNAGSLYLMALVFVSYVSKVISLPSVPTMVALLAVFCVINLVGVNVTGGVSRVLVVLKIAALGVFVVLGIPFVRAANFAPFLPTGWWGVLAALPLLSGLYMGLETGVEVGEEIRNSASVIAKGLGFTMSITIVVYFAVSFVAVGALGAPGLAASSAPILDAGRLFLGRWTNILIVVTAAAAIGAAINATYLIFARFLFAMGRDGVLPAVLGRIHPKWGTPYVAILVVFALALVSFFLPSSLLFLFLAANIPVMLKYVSHCWAAARLVEHHPELHRRAKFMLSRRAVKAWSYAGIGLAVVTIFSGVGADWRPYAILCVWGGLGLVYWFARSRHTRATSRVFE